MKRPWPLWTKMLLGPVAFFVLMLLFVTYNPTEDNASVMKALPLLILFALALAYGMFVSHRGSVRFYNTSKKFNEMYAKLNKSTEIVDYEEDE